MTDSATTDSRYYLTTPIYYVNARPHLGHAYSTIVCDAIARRKRALGIETWFLTGTDEHGQKIERSAEKAGRSPQEFADAISAEFSGLWRQLGLTHDDFIRTTSERHKRGVQHLFAELQRRGFIYKGSYSGQYCVSDELYVDGPPGTVCPDCGRVTETVSEENYFFKLSAFERKLLEFYEANPSFMGPESTRREVVSFVRSGLRDLSVSRTSFSWGIPVPGDEKHVIYVWLDALANYITALGYGSDDPADQARFTKFWPADLHLIGKEISRFHCVYWPAFLMAAGIPLPRSVRANGWLLFDQGKMSKSRGNIVRAETVHTVLGSDALRYFLLREIPFGQDGSFSFDALVQRYNGDLANGYGNLVSRVVNMVHKYFGGILPEAGASTIAEDSLRESAVRAIAAFGPEFDAMNFSEALKALWVLVAETDGYLTANAPWKKPADRSDSEHAALQARVLATAAEAIRIITALVYPILPVASAKVWAQLGLGDLQSGFIKIMEYGKCEPILADDTVNLEKCFKDGLIISKLEAGTQFADPAPLFPRAEKDAVARMQQIEEDNSKSVIEAAGGTCGAANSGIAATTADPTPGADKGITEGDGGFIPRVKPIETTGALQAAENLNKSHEASGHDFSRAVNATQKTGALAPEGHTEEIMSQESAKQTSWENAPVDSIGVDAAVEAKAYETVAQAATAAEALSSGEKALYQGTTSVVPPTPQKEAGALAPGGTTAPAEPTYISIDDVIKVDLRVAQILVAERIPKADKLLRLEVDLGYEKRQILAGIAQYYEPEKLIGRKIVIVANLAPRKMRGLESNGMLLAASLEGGAPVLAGFLEDVPLGARLK